MADYSIVTDTTLKKAVKDILSKYIVPNMIKTNDDEVSSLYTEKKTEFQTVLAEAKLQQQDS